MIWTPVEPEDQMSAERYAYEQAMRKREDEDFEAERERRELERRYEEQDEHYRRLEQ